MRRRVSPQRRAPRSRRLEQMLRVYVQHYNAHRAHRALGLQPPDPAVGLTLTGKDQPDRIYRRDLLGGLVTSTDKLHERIYAPYGLVGRVLGA